MKKSKQSLTVIIVLLLISLTVYVLFPKPPVSLDSIEKRAVWITYQDLSKLSYESKSEFKKGFQKIVKNVKKYKNNTIIVHVRPFCDALYSSKIFPLSQVVTHQEKINFDPLKEMITIAHKANLLLEAWINPYRISLNQYSYQQFMCSAYKSWIKKPDYTISYGKYQYILNPENEEVRQLIVKGVREVVEQYDIDGIHFDDYFYVEGTQTHTTQNERMDNVNMLIQDVYHTIHSLKQDVVFGISPQGNYENCLAQGADVSTWLKEEGYIDYLMPQIYWTDDYYQNKKIKMFTNRVKLYAQLKRHSGVKIYVGLALYQAGKKLELDRGWSKSHHNISQQVDILYRYGYDGYAIFRYSSLLTKKGQKEMDELLRSHP